MSKDFNEKDALEELKIRTLAELESDMYEDETLFLRFLKARAFNVDNAEKMLRQHLQWRKKFDVRNISKCKHPEVLEKYMPMIKLGYDKEGCIVHYLPSGNIDWIGLNASCKLEDITKRLIHIYEDDLEDLRKQSKKLGKSVCKIVYIHCLKNLSFTQATDKKVVFNFIYFLNIYQSQYPETLKAIIVINASIYFDLLFSVMKTFLPSEILQKIRIYSDDSWKEDLLKTIDPEVLPEFLGGTRTDPDGNPQCLTFINHGESVPERYYIHRSKRSLANLPDVKKVTLSRAAFHEVFIEVKDTDSYLEWEFETQSRDIGFGLFYQDKEENKAEIVPLQRINTDEYAESGVYKCENVGTYIVVFDNTYSVLRSKDIFYKIKVLTPQEETLHLIN